MFLPLKSPTSIELMFQFIAKVQDKLPTSCKISKIIFSTKGSLLFLNKDI